MESPSCKLCKHPTQNSTHRFYSYPNITPVWDLMSEITKNTPIEHAFSETCSIINVIGVPMNHQLILLTNFTGFQIESAHCNKRRIHPNALIYKNLNLSGILKYNDNRYRYTWSEISNQCKEMLKLFNPQFL